MANNNEVQNLNGPAPEKVSDLSLKISYWYVNNKLRLRQGLLFFLIGLNILVFGFVFYRLVMMLIIEQKDYQSYLNNLQRDYISYDYFHQANRPAEVKILSFSATDGRDSTYDFIVKLQNVNEKYIADPVLIQLVSGDQVLAEKELFIYPKEVKYSAFFRQKVDGPNPVIKIAKTGWKRYLKFSDYADPRLKFVVTDQAFSSAFESGYRGELPISTLNFNITNNSGFSYWNVGLYIVLSSADQIVAGNFYRLDQFVAGQTRKVSLQWYEPLPDISNIEIVPEVDIMSPSSFMPVANK